MSGAYIFIAMSQIFFVNLTVLVERCLDEGATYLETEKQTA